MRPRPGPLPPPDPAPALRVPDRAMPAYRYVPGLHPHPFRHVGGHLYTDGSPPPEAPWTPGPWQADARWLHGLDLFDHRYYWECHEVLEALWHQVPRDSSHGRLLQGLIQAAASVLKGHVGSPLGSARLHAKACAHLAAVADAEGACWRGLDLPATIVALERWQTAGVYPLLAPPTRRP